MVSYLYRGISSPPILVATLATCPEKKRYEPISTAPTQMSRGGKYGCKPPLFLVPTRWFHHFPKAPPTPNPEYTHQPVPSETGSLTLIFFSMPRCDPLFWCGGCATCASPVQPPLAFCHHHKRTPASPSTPATLHPYPSRQLLWLTM